MSDGHNDIRWHTDTKHDTDTKRDTDTEHQSFATLSQFLQKVAKRNKICANRKYRNGSEKSFNPVRIIILDITFT